MIETRRKDVKEGMRAEGEQNTEARSPRAGRKERRKENLLMWFSALFILASDFWLLTPAFLTSSLRLPPSSLRFSLVDKAHMRG
jgi:hypothetical protein